MHIKINHGHYNHNDLRSSYKFSETCEIMISICSNLQVYIRQIYYQAICQYLGFVDYGDEYIVMALGLKGKKRVFFELKLKEEKF